MPVLSTASVKVIAFAQPIVEFLPVTIASFPVNDAIRPPHLIPFSRILAIYQMGMWTMDSIQQTVRNSKSQVSDMIARNFSHDM